MAETRKIVIEILDGESESGGEKKSKEKIFKITGLYNLMPKIV